MTDPLPTRKQYHAVREELRLLHIDYKKVVIEKNRAEAKILQLNKRSEEYLEIYKKQFAEINYLAQQLKGNEI